MWQPSTRKISRHQRKNKNTRVLETFPCLQIGKNNIVKMSILPNVSSRSSVIPQKISVTFFTEPGESPKIYIDSWRTADNQSNHKQEDYCGGHHTSRLWLTLLNNSNQASMGLPHSSTCISGIQEGHRIKPRHLGVFVFILFFMTKMPKNTLDKRWPF